MRDQELVTFLQWALPRLRLRWEGFRKVRRQVGKRLSRRLAELSLQTLDQYRERLKNDPKEWSTLDDLCHIAISCLYRDRHVFDTLSAHERLRHPVTISQRNKRRLVLLSIEDYQRLKRGADPRQAHTLDTMPDDLFEGAKAALDPYEQQTETP